MPAMELPTRDELLGLIRAFLERHDMAPTRFGRDATGEPQLIKSIEAGRSPSLDVLHKLRGFMAAKDAELDLTRREEAARKVA